jgi:predicted TIM-barrel fold metal-dependent hydrolase
MKKLVELNAGRLLTFVAWSPRRSHDIDVVQRAIDEKIAIGVKVYPPSGYRPDDKLNDALFDLCSTRGISVFAHCTPEGMEAKKGFGKNSDPKYWRAVLTRNDKKWNEMKLCLAHAGDDGPWFGAPKQPWRGSFAERAYELAVDPATPNVYLEFGFHDSIFDPKLRKNFVSILAAKIAESKGRLADRIMYGTDWHMIQRLPDHARYYSLFAEVFRDPALAKYAERFFRGNAVEYLGLKEYAARRAAHDPVRKHIEGVVARSKGTRAQRGPQRARRAH